MDTLEAINTRRSIRKYTNEAVPSSMIRPLLDAAMRAPSALDQRPWHFVLIDDRSVLSGLADSMEHCDMLKESTLGLLICGDESLAQLKEFWVQDCSACAENVLLAAHAQGLGAVWIGLYPIDGRMEAVRSSLGIPDAITPFALISMGLPAETLPGEDRYDQTRLHTNHW